MSRSGLFTQFGVADESTYGTYVAPTRFLEFLEESMKLDIERNESKGLRSGQRILRQDHWKAGKRGAAGSVSLEVPNKGFGVFLKHMLGTIATTTDGTGRIHTASLGDLFGDYMTMQFGRPDIAGTVQPFSYVGCKVVDWELTNSPDEYLICNLGIDARDESTSQALVAATAPSATDIFHWSECTVTVGGSSFEPQSIAIKGTNGQKTDRHHLRGSGLKKEPIENEMREITVELDADFESLTAYNRYSAGTHVAVVSTWTSTLNYDTAKPFKVVVTINAARTDGDTPNIDGADLVPQKLSLKAVDDGTNPPIQIAYYTSDTTP